MSTKKFDLSTDQKQEIKDQLRDAYDFDPKDPLFGLTRENLSGSQISRRSVLRLMAVSGTLTAWHLLPGAKKAFAQKRGGILEAGWAGVGEITTLDPARINQVLQFQITSSVLSGLTHLNADLVAEADLAESWTVNNSATEIVFKLREGVTFHNGDKFTADDVIYTFNRSKDPDRSINGGLLKNVASLEKLNDYEVKFTLSAPQASFFVKTTERASGRALTIVSRGAIEELGPQQYGLTPVGTGPFRVTEHTLGQSVKLRRFDDYYDPERPVLDGVNITPISEPEPLAAAMEAGDIQLIGGNPVAPELVDRFMANSEIVVDIIGGNGFQSVFLNPWRDPFKVPSFDKPVSELMKEKGFKVRLAIAKAIDRDRFIERAQFGRGVPAFGTINPAMGFFFDENLGETSNQKFDAPAARKLLADAGYPNGDGFPTLTMKGGPPVRRDMQIIADMLKTNLNITINVEIREFQVLVPEFQKVDYDMLRIGSGGDFDPDDGIVDFMQSTSRLNGANRDKSAMAFGHFGEADVDKLGDEQSRTSDLNKRRELVQKVNRITSDKVASAFIYHPVDTLVHRKEVNFPSRSRIVGLVDLDRVSFT
jgi:ABC-type transport system substrate-binding protein